MQWLATRRHLLTMGALSAAAAFLLAGYECVRSVSNSLFIEAYGAKQIPYVMAASPPTVLLMVWFYGWVLSRVGPHRTLVLTTILSSAALGACYLAVAAGSRPATVLLYVIREGYIVVLIEQYWALANSTLTTRQAKSLNGPFTGCGSLGAIAGGLLVGQLAEAIGSQSLLLVAAALLLPAAVFGAWAYRSRGEPRPSAEERAAPRGILAAGVLFRSGTLVRLALLIGTTQVVSALLDLRFHGLAEQAMSNMDQRSAYFGGFWSCVNGITFGLQFVVAPLALRRLPLRIVHLAIPAAHLIACGALILRPSILTAAIAFLLFKSLDYSVFRAAKEILYVPLSFDARYRCKALIDMFGYRLAKSATSLAVLGVRAMTGTLAGGGYVFAAAATLLGWAVLAHGATRGGNDDPPNPIPS